MKNVIIIKGLKIKVEIEEKMCIDYATGERKLMKTFSMSGDKRGYGGGQIFTGLKEKMLEGTYTPKINAEQTVLILRLIAIWEDYHLNCMQGGTKKQVDYIEKHGLNALDYSQRCDRLKEEGLYVDSFIIGQNKTPKGRTVKIEKFYTYGGAWLCKEIPQRVLDNVDKIIRELARTKNCQVIEY